MRARLLLPVLLLAPVGFIGLGRGAPLAPKFANIVAACTPNQSPAVQPPQLHVTFAENVLWRVTSGPATSWTITPKDPQRWPYPASIDGNPQAPADSGLPAPGTALGSYGYNVTITCADGSTQTIDPEIIIGADQPDR